MPRSLAILLLALVGPLALRAQSSEEVVERATDARADWRGAGEALASHDTGAALAALDHASLLWPTQAAYPAAHFRLAVAARRPDEALRAARRLLAIGLTLVIPPPAEALLHDAAGWPAVADSLRAAGRRSSEARSSAPSRTPCSTRRGWPTTPPRGGGSSRASASGASWRSIGRG